MENTKPKKGWFSGLIANMAMLIAMFAFFYGMLHLLGEQSSTNNGEEPQALVVVKLLEVENTYPVSVMTWDNEYPVNTKEDSLRMKVQMLSGETKVVEVEGWKNAGKEDSNLTLKGIPTRIEYVSTKIKNKYGFNLLDDKEYPLSWISTADHTHDPRPVMMVDGDGEEALYRLSLHEITSEPTLEFMNTVPTLKGK